MMQRIQNISQDNSHADHQKIRILFFSKYAPQAEKIQKKKAAMKALNDVKEAENPNHMEEEEGKRANNAIINNPNSVNEIEKQMFYPPLGNIDNSVSLNNF